MNPLFIRSRQKIKAAYGVYYVVRDMERVKANVGGHRAHVMTRDNGALTRLAPPDRGFIDWQCRTG